MKRQDTDKLVRLDFDGMGDLLEYLKDIPKDNYSVTHCKNEWAGGSFKHAVDLARHGDPTRAQNIYEGVCKMKNEMLADDTSWRRDVAGAYFDVGDFLAGEPECFWEQQDEPAKPVVEVIVNASMNAAVEADVIRNRGAAAVALCDALANDGYTIDLQVVQVSSKLPLQGRMFESVVHFPNNPLDLDAVSYAVSNAGYVRRLGFGLKEMVTGYSNLNPVCFYGMPDDIKPEAGQIYFTSSNHRSFSEYDYETPERAARHILEALKDFDGTKAVSI